MEFQGSTGYRPDVDGLRAVAVLTVILFHLHRPWLPGGFLGVDIFFVISGFLITRNIIQGLDDGRFSIAEFYRRRIKRIAPAMLVVVAATLVTSQVLLTPKDASSTAKSAVFSLASVANVYFWRFRDWSYFAPDGGQEPLLHLWSLGVEEQFYLLWPLLLMVGYRRLGWQRLAGLGVIVAVLSFVTGDLVYERDSSFAYYMLPTRAGELLLGGLVAMAVLRHVEERVRPAVVSILATLGALLLAASLFLITEGQPFPGWRAVPPTAGTALIILAGHCRQGIWSRLLGSRVMVGIGLLSYSAYLWHWPLLAFFRYGYGDPGAVAATVIVVLTFVLAWLTLRFVEQPARRSMASVRQVMFRMYIVPASVLMTLALVLVYSERLGISARSRSYSMNLAVVQDQTRPATSVDWVCQGRRLSLEDTQSAKCVLGLDSSRAPVAVTWGDSHVAHYAGMLRVFADAGGFRLRSLAVSSCPPLLNDPTAFIDPKRRSDCLASQAVMQPLLESYPVVIVSSAWLSYQERNSAYLETFFNSVRTLVGAGKYVVVLGEAPWVRGYDRHCREKALTYPFLQCPEISVPVSTDVADVNTRLRQFAELTTNVAFFDVTPYLCPNGLCSAFQPSGEPNYFDESHLTVAASLRLGREIVADEGVPKPFGRVADWSHAARGQQR